MTPKPGPKRYPPDSLEVKWILGENMKAWRSLSGLKQADLADEMAALGHEWSATTVSEIERGKRHLRAEEVYGLALVLRVNPPWRLLDPGGVEGRDAPIDFGMSLPVPIRTARYWFHGRIKGRVEDGGFAFTYVEGEREAFEEAKDDVEEDRSRRLKPTEAERRARKRASDRQNERYRREKKEGKR